MIHFREWDNYTTIKMDLMNLIILRFRLRKPYSGELELRKRIKTIFGQL